MALAAASVLTQDPDRLVLWGARTGNCLRAAMGLLEAGVPHTVRLVDLPGLEHRSREHLARNPAGKVPVLSGEAWGAPLHLTQSNAILFFADQAAPGRLLPQEGDPDRFVAIDRFFYFLTDVIALNGAAFSLKQHRLVDGARILMERSMYAIEMAERYAAEGPYLAGAAFSMADIAAITVVTSVASHLPWHELPHLDAWRKRVGERPRVQRGWRAFEDNISTPLVSVEQ